MFHTFSYKKGYIHLSYVDNVETIKVQVDDLAFPETTKSVRSAKIKITKHLKSQALKAEKLKEF